LENDISSANEVTPVHQVYTLSHKGNLLEIKTEETHNISVSAYNMVGQLLKNKQVLSNQPFDLSLPSGQFLIQFSLNGVSHLESVFMFRD